MRPPSGILPVLRRTLTLAIALLGIAVAAPVSAGWSPEISGLGGPSVELRLDPDRPELLYARVQGYFQGNLSGGYLWRSLDAGATWRSLQTSLGRSVRALAVDPGDPRVIWAWTYEHELWRSGDMGETWSRRFASPPLSYPEVYQLLVDPRQPETIYRVEYWNSVERAGLRVAVSRDGGATFHLGALLPTIYYKDKDPISVSSRSGELFAFTSKGLAVSADGGRSWRMRGRFHQGLLAGALAPSHPDTLYVLTAGSALLERSDDAGASWRVVTRPRLPNSYRGFYGIAVDPRNARHLWLSAYIALDEKYPTGISNRRTAAKPGRPPFPCPLPAWSRPAARSSTPA